MEQVRHARIPVHLNAVLIGEKTVPKGCKVRNVSNQGLLLQCDADGRILTFRDGDHVDIHLLFHRPDGTKYHTITATVRHVDANGIGVEFCQPDAGLVKLIESYRIDETRSIEATITHHRNAAGRRRSASVVTIPTTGPSANAERRQQPDDARGRRMFYIGLLSLTIAVIIFTAAYLRSHDMAARVTQLESLIRAKNGELARIQSQPLASDNTGGGADEHMAAMKSGGPALKPKHESPAVVREQVNAPATTSTADTPVTHSVSLSRAEAVTGAPNAEQGGSADQVAGSVSVDARAAEARGPWVINLLSSPNRSDADQFAERARKQGIPVDLSSVRLKDREFYRVQLTGFQTRRQAETDAGPVKEQLGLKDVWIFKP